MLGFCEHNNKTLYTIKCGVFTHQLRKYQVSTNFVTCMFRDRMKVLICGNVLRRVGRLDVWKPFYWLSSGGLYNPPSCYHYSSDRWQNDKHG